MYTKSVLLFSLFIEHVSLFSQFLIMMSFNKEKIYSKVSLMLWKLHLKKKIYTVTLV
ncbi:MAG: hypothetical protein CM15mV51_1410 [uncultured marine virus]|nr:MAG: hypothetical protein CM15mV51_1410 [uncultured marine virus]